MLVEVLLIAGGEGLGETAQAADALLLAAVFVPVGTALKDYGVFHSLSILLGAVLGYTLLRDYLARRAARASSTEEPPDPQGS